MSNPLYNSMMPQGNNNVLQRFMQFKNSFRGDPRQQIQQMLNSGKVSQEQYNNAVRMAQQLQRILNAQKV